MIEQTIKDANERMEKSLHSLEIAFNKIRTGRAHPSLLDSVMVSYYGSDTPLSQLANGVIRAKVGVRVSSVSDRIEIEIVKSNLTSSVV